jgi:hypothetical protein
MKYIVSTDYPLLEQQVEVYNNMYNYPLNDTLTYSNIVKNYQAPIWYINVLDRDLQYVLPSLQSSITSSVAADWCAPIYN